MAEVRRLAHALGQTVGRTFQASCDVALKTRGKWRTVELLACPVTWRPHPEQIASARRGYEDWWLALDWVQDGLILGGMLQEVEVTAAMSKARPWAL